ncbi:helix-turn-helix domain-containing protein [Paenibacillus thalictri]|uniref:Helix-turn-helix domain-containing protein n=1 Tax=Paenibacillus thalictri TaxID=2527873 RepID=A0A4Q9DVV6_9BACL|nr:helix-turn-helix domain-containing protein [Paenibacillus thalictri]TBL81159.1 helix-turn-helix domain-containing protein [Paenibacillus thalictri]
MWNVLLVEDEDLVKQQLKQQLHWEAYGFQIVGEADHGKAALDMISRLKPDLVISDIIMPVMDGLQLLKLAKERGFDGCFIMLTCMNEFEYARQALELGAIGYCLKLSTTPERIGEVLMKADQFLRQRSTMQTKALFGDMHPWLEYTWDQMMTANNSQPAEMAAGGSQTEIIGQTICICSVMHGSAKLAVSDLLRWGVLKTGIEPFVSFFSRMGHTTFFITKSNALQLSATAMIPYPAIVCADVPFGNLASMWKQVLLKLSEFWYAPHPGIYKIIMNNIHSAREGAPFFSWPLERELFVALENLQKDRCEELLSHIWSRMKEEQVPMYHVKKAAERIYHTCLRIANHTEENKTAEIWASYSHTELQKLMQDQLAYLLQALAAEKSLTTDHPEINRLIVFMRQHYSNPLSLQELADRVNIEKHYLSGLFKKKTGQSIMQYLHQIRIEHAMRYLSNTELPIIEIAEKTGFASDNYFIKAFRKTTGRTPSEYRKSNSALQT